MKKSISVLGLLIVTALIFIGVAMSSSVHMEASDKPATEYLNALNNTTRVLGPLTDSVGERALLIQDGLPWDLSSNELALNSLGVAYDVISSDGLAATDLSDYKFVMYSSDQPPSYYANIAANLAKLEAYVVAGGFLIAHSCDMGWHEGGWADLKILPGDVVIGHIWYSRDDIHIESPAHPVADGLTDAELSDWNSATHGYFTNLPAGTDTVMVTNGNLPTYIDYTYGSGRVIATMQTIEWQYAGYYRQPPTTRFLLNEINYALGQVGPTNHPPDTPLVPTGPVSGSAWVSYSYQTSSRDQDGDQVQITIDWGDGTMTTSDPVGSETAVSLTHTWTAAGTYQVKAMATDSKSATSAWSGSLTVTIAPNRRPNAPSKLTGPTFGYVGVSYPFLTQGTDPDGDRIKYTYDWGDGTTYTTIWVNSGTTASVSHKWAAAGTYQVRTMIIDSKGAPSPWSIILTVRIVNRPQAGMVRES